MTDLTRIEVRRQIRAIMVERGLSERELAEAIGFKESYVTNVITGFSTGSKARFKINEYFDHSFWPIN